MIIQKNKTKLTNPYIICGWPGMGMIGHYIVNHIISQIKPEIFAEIDYKEYIIPHNAIVENGIIYDIPQIQNKIFYHKIKSKYYEQDFLLFLGDVEPSLYNMQNFANDLISFFKPFNPKLIMTFSGFPSNILHTDEPLLYVAQTNNSVDVKIKNEESLKLKPLTFGLIEGMSGIILSKAKEFEIEGICIIGEIPFYTIDMINPRVCYKILYFLKETFLFNISFEKIQQDIISMDERIKSTFIDLNEKAQMLLSQLQDSNKDNKKNLYYKAKTTNDSSELTFEELKKKIKFSLPESAKNKINELFKLSSEDISYAKQLKEELDKWGVYKEYEDRFLSLFIKKKKGKK